MPYLTLYDSSRISILRSVPLLLRYSKYFVLNFLDSLKTRRTVLCSILYIPLLYLAL
jgi:hypothetical protein